VDVAPGAARADLDLKLTELDSKCMANGVCALAPVKVRVHQGSGFDEKGSRRLPARNPRDGDGDRRGLATLTVVAEHIDEGSLGELTAA
jgi:hypothetical protein